MKVKWLQDVSLNVTETFDEETDTADEYTVNFKQDEVTEFDIFDDRGDTVNIQFGDGSVAYGVPKSLYEIIDIEEEAEELEQLRRDEKNGLYGGQVDIAN